MSVSRYFTKAPWETKIGYCRAIRAGNHIYVTGTAPIDENGDVVSVGDPYGQARCCLELIQKALAELQSDLSNVVRTRMFVTKIDHWEEYGRAHAEFFAEYPPATTMVEVESLIDPAMMIEIEAEAVVSD